MRRPNPIALLTLLLAVGFAGCDRSGDTPGSPQAQLQPLPALDLSAAEPAAREQLEAQRRAVDALASQSGTTPEDLADAHGQLGLLYLTYEYLDAAQVAIDNARVLDGTDFRWPYLAGYLGLQRGDQDAAVLDFEASLDLQPGYVPALLRMGRARADAGDPVTARGYFQSALALDAAVAAVHEGLGRAALATGDAEQALEHFGHALELDPQADALHYARAQALRQLGRLDEARDALTVSGATVTQIPDPLLQPLGGLAQSVQFFLMQGSEAMVAERYDDAAGSFRTALERDPTHFDAYRGLAISLQRLGDPAGAARTLEQALEKVGADDESQLVTRRAALHRSLGLLARAEGADQAALAHFLRSLELVPGQPGLLLRAADALARQGKFEDAIQRYDVLLEQEPEWGPMLWEKRATAKVNLRDESGAIADFERAVAAAPDDARLRERYAAALEYLHADARAQAQRNQADGLAKDRPQEAAALLVERGKQSARDGDLEAAIQAFHRALELDPERTDDRYALASMLAHKGQLDDARTELKRVLAELPKHRGAHRDLAAVLLLSGRYGEARVALQEAIRVFPQNLGFALTQVELLSTSPEAEVRDGRLALEIAQRVSMADTGPVARQSLAFALAAAGRFDDAVAIQQELVDQAEGAGNQDVADALRQRLERFESGKIWIASSPTDIIAMLMASP